MTDTFHSHFPDILVLSNEDGSCAHRGVGMITGLRLKIREFYIYAKDIEAASMSFLVCMKSIIC